MRQERVAIRGVLVVAALLVVALLMAVGAVWYHRNQTRRTLALWGPAAARLIAEADDVVLCRLAPLGRDAVVAANDTLRTAHATFVIQARRAIVETPGFTHIRWWLCRDTSFAWDAPPDCPEPRWEFALRFRQNGSEVTLLFDVRCDAVARLGNPRAVSYRPIAREIKDVLGRAAAGASAQSP